MAKLSNKLRIWESMHEGSVRYLADDALLKMMGYVTWLVRPVPVLSLNDRSSEDVELN